MLRSDGPNALTSAAYAEDFNEVKDLGSLASTSRTADQTAAAIFWQDSGISIWNRVFRALAESERLDGVESARLLAMTNLAGADGSIGCWNDKYYWNFWRPITAIREAASDGNPATEADPAWLPLFNPTIPVSGPQLVTPGFPDHPSGHTCISGAFVHALQAFFGTDRIAFTAISNKCSPAPCPTRSFDRFSEALKEIIGARVWSGIHFRTADVQGAVLGKKVAQYLGKHYFQAQAPPGSAPSRHQPGGAPRRSRSARRSTRRRRARGRKNVMPAPGQEGRPEQRKGRGSSGGGIRTRDLRVMSPTSYQTAPPRVGTRSLPRAWVFVNDAQPTDLHANFRTTIDLLNRWPTDGRRPGDPRSQGRIAE